MSLWKIDFFKSEQIKTLNQLTIKVEIAILKVFYHQDIIIFKDNEEIIPCSQSLQTMNGQYEWRVDDEEIVKKMKSAANGDDFISPFFEMNDTENNRGNLIKWCLKSYPNGYDATNLGKGNTFLRLASFPPNVGMISMCYTVGLRETNTKFSAVERFSDNAPSFGWTANLLKFDEQIEKNENLNSFTFFTIIRIIDVYDINGDIITDQFIMNNEDQNNKDEDNVMIDSIRKMKICKYWSSTPFNYEWSITDPSTLIAIKKATNGKNFLSPLFSLFGMRWYLEFMPVPIERDPEFGESDKDNPRDHTILYLCAASVSPNIKEIRMNYTLTLKETDTIYQNTTELDGLLIYSYLESDRNNNI